MSRNFGRMLETAHNSDRNPHHRSALAHDATYGRINDKTDGICHGHFVTDSAGRRCMVKYAYDASDARAEVIGNIIASVFGFPTRTVKIFRGIGFCPQCHSEYRMGGIATLHVLLPNGYVTAKNLSRGAVPVTPSADVIIGWQRFVLDVMDAIVGNIDRHDSNWMVNPSDGFAVAPIDNGFSGAIGFLRSDVDNSDLFRWLGHGSVPAYLPVSAYVKARNRIVRAAAIVESFDTEFRAYAPALVGTVRYVADRLDDAVRAEVADRIARNRPMMGAEWRNF